ncbi:MAG: helix-turn-helix transcriptional regulator [Oscillospiraceae bacterium]|nr:helix-turn-helix transcriptional regulator [Oscillospiraceae bacterium]
MNMIGPCIRRERMRRNWSQRGLCRGICSASYLSKLEQGSAEASEEIIRLLLGRLELPWYGGAQSDQACRARVEALYEALLSADDEAFEKLWTDFAPDAALLQCSPFAADAAILCALHAQDASLAADIPEDCFDRRQLAFLRLLQGRADESIRLLPDAYFYYMAGVSAYERGENYAAALEYLQTACAAAANEGRANLMLQCRMIMGNCYCNQVDLPHMADQFAVARRLAAALGRADTIRVIEYNTASSQLEAGDPAAACRYFASLADPGVMELHKLAVCCEKLGRKDEALRALDAADATAVDFPPEPLARAMCRLVRMRLENSGWLRDPAYGALLLSCFDDCRRQLPIGYASFHLPWVLEWHTANRQYKQAYELIAEFPVKMIDPVLNADLK